MNAEDADMLDERMRDNLELVVSMAVGWRIAAGLGDDAVRAGAVEALTKGVTRHVPDLSEQETLVEEGRRMIDRAIADARAGRPGRVKVVRV